MPLEEKDFFDNIEMTLDALNSALSILDLLYAKTVAGEATDQDKRHAKKAWLSAQIRASELGGEIQRRREESTFND